MSFTAVARIIRKRRLAGLYLEALAELILCKAMLALIPFGRWAHRQGRFQSESLKENRTGDLPRIRSMRDAVERLGRRLPWNSKCLDQALAIQRMLSRRGLSTTIYYGMIRDESGKWTAHAWVRCGNVWAIGYHPDRQYTVVGCYARD